MSGQRSSIAARRRAAGRGALEPARIARFDSWGGATHGLSHAFRPQHRDDVIGVFEEARRSGASVGLRGAGCSYGDAPLNAERISLDTTRLDRVLEWDAAEGIARVEPGVTIEKLWRHALPFGLWPAVVPGTMFPTIAGCAAMNIHGKNNFSVGPIGDHIESFEILLANGEVRRCNRNQDGELFHAAIGGFGVLGCFLSVTLRLKRVHSGLLEVRPFSAASLDHVFDVFEKQQETSDYLVGWIDAFAAGRASGRGLVHSARYLDPGEDTSPSASLRPDAQGLPDRLLGLVPMRALWRFLRPFTNDPGLRMINALKHHSAAWSSTKPYRQSLVGFSFLLDYVPGWKRAYGAGGLVQYQSFVPKERARATFRGQLETCRRRCLPPYLAVFKRHRPDAFLMTHSVDGYSLALDFKVTEANRGALLNLTEELDAGVLDASGRFYFAKDSTLSARARFALRAEARTQRFLELKRSLDPQGLFETDLYRRVFGSAEGSGSSAS